MSRTIIAAASIALSIACLATETRAANLTPGTGLDYASASSWSIAGVPGDGSFGAENAHIAFGTGDTRTAVYSSATNFTTTGRTVIGLGSGTGGLTLNGSAGTLSFGGNDFGGANYVGVDGGAGSLDIQAGTFATTGAAYLRVGSNGPTATGAVTVGGTGTLSVNEILLLGSAGSSVNNSRANTGSLTIDAGGTANIGNGGTALIAGHAGNQTVGTITVNGGTLSVNGNTFLNASGGTGTLDVRGDSTVTLTGNLSLEGSPVGSGLTFPSGVGTINARIVDGQFNTITTSGSLNLNPDDASRLRVSVDGTQPALGTSWDIVSYGTSDPTENFDVGTQFGNNQGYIFGVDYGSGTADDVTLTLLAKRKSILVDVGPAGGLDGDGGLSQTTYDGAAWNNFGAIAGATDHGGVQYADGTEATGVTISATGVSGRDGNTTLNAGWGDAQAVPQEVIDSWYFAGATPITFTVKGLNPNAIYDVDLFNAFNTGTNLSDMQINGLFADGTSGPSASSDGDSWDRAADGWTAKSGLFFDDISPNGSGEFIITFTGVSPLNPTVQAIRITQVVPEPGTFLLLGLGLVALMLRRRR